MTNLTIENNNSVVAKITFYGADVVPDDLTAELQIAPTSTWRCGDFIGRTKRRRDDHGWVLAAEAGSDLESAVAGLILRLQPAWNTFAAAAARHQTEIGVVVYARQFMPPLHVPREQLMKLASLSADVDIDVYSSYSE